MDEFIKIRELYKLKEVYRRARVKERRESAAEHTWSCLVLADYLMDKYKKLKLDQHKVYDLLLYHDLVEIEAGDIPIHLIKDQKAKRKNEFLALYKTQKKIPADMGKKFERLFKEFDEGKTKEAKFAKAVDKLDGLLQHMNHKKDWKGWDAERIRGFHGEALSKIPEISRLFEEFLKYLDKAGYLNVR